MERAMSAGGRRLPVVEGDRTSGVTPAFQHIAVVGLGALGGSLAMALRQAWPAALVIGVDRPGVLEAAMRLHIVDLGAEDLMIAGGADLVVLAGTAAANGLVLGRLADAIRGDAVITDTGGGAGDLTEAADSLPGRLAFVAGRPLLESVAGGIEDAAAGVFAGRSWLLAPVTAAAGVMERLQSAVRAVGAEPVVVPPPGPGERLGDGS
jgi:prephenate dehydrogenase